MEKSLVGENILFSDVCGIIDNSRKRVAVYVNSEICLVKWHVGKRIREDVLYNQRAEYGKQIVKNLSVKLTNKYGSGWSYESLKHCLRVANIFTEEEIGYAVRIQFSWTHIRSLSSLTDPLARQFYMEMCRIEHWDTRTLDAKIKPEHEGQMRLYLRYLNKNERREGEESPIGLILCSEGNTEHVEYLMLDEESSIKVAQYYTQLPDKKLLAEKLQRAIVIAREQCVEQKTK